MTKISLLHLAALLCLASLLGCISEEVPGTIVPPTADQDPALPQRQITVAGHAIAIHTETFGDPTRPALFLLHDALADYRAFKVFEALADRYFVVMWDRRGDGLSQRFADEPYNADTLVEEIDALKAIHSPDQPISLLAHGWGATYAAIYLGRRPANVRQAVLMEPLPLNGVILYNNYSNIIKDSTWNNTFARMIWQAEALTPSNQEKLDYKALLYRADARWNNYHCNGPPSPTVLPIWRPGGYVEYLRDEMVTEENSQAPMQYMYDFASGLKAFPAAVEILAGSCSFIGPAFQTMNHLPFFQTAKVTTIDHAGHDMFIDQPETVLGAIRAYLEEY